MLRSKVKWSIAVRRRLTATGTHGPYGITQYYLLPGRSDIPAFTPAEAGTRSISQFGESAESVLKEKRKATVGRIYRKGRF